MASTAGFSRSSSVSVSASSSSFPITIAFPWASQRFETV
jgi:hypothetical protein